MYDTIFLGLIVSFVTLGVSSLFLAFSYGARSGSSPQMDRLQRLLGQAAGATTPIDLEPDEAEHLALRERVLKPVVDALTATYLRLLPSGVIKTLQEKLDSAGNPGNLTAMEFLSLRLIFAVGGLVIAGISLASAGEQGITSFPVLIGLLLAFFVLMLPDTGLSRVIENRRYRMRKALPDVIDLLVVCVEAGIGFDGAMAKVVEKSKGPLAEEFDRVLQEMRIGKGRANSLRDLAKRAGIAEINAFVAAICQADQTGASLSATLSSQATMMRDRRSQRIREMAAKLPVKMLFPLVFCIFPAIFVVLLGAGIIQLIRTFGAG